jgi:hypothetical protein
MTNEAVMQFASSETRTLSMAVDLVNGANSWDTTNFTEVLVDNSSDLYPLATATLHLPDGWLTAPTDNSTIDLYMVRHDTEGANDDGPVPIAVDLLGAEYVGSFPVWVASAGAAYRKSITISMAGVKKAQYYIKNSTGQTIDYDATPITLDILPFTYAPAA